MLIQVQYLDSRYDYVNEPVLNKLIDSKAILGFRRSSEWLTIGVGPLRKLNRSSKIKTNTCYKPAGVVKSIIRVVYNDNRCDYVTNIMFDNLLELDKIAKFQRSTGWVTVGIDSIRMTKRKHTYNSYPNKLKKRLL